MSNVLILEDDIVDQMALMRMMENNFSSFHVERYYNISEATNALKSNSFHWIISDFNLPDGTLKDVLPFIGSAKLICVSGELERAEINALEKNGLYKFLIKDQQLNYLQAIKHEMDNSSTLSKPSIENLQPATSTSILQILQKQFSDEKKIKIEILKIFIRDILPVQIPKLISAINDQDHSSTHFLSHKIQSSFRVLGATDILEILNFWEIRTAQENANWNVINKHKAAFNSKIDNFEKLVNSCLTNLTD